MRNYVLFRPGWAGILPAARHRESRSEAERPLPMQELKRCASPQHAQPETWAAGSDPLQEPDDDEDPDDPRLLAQGRRPLGRRAKRRNATRLIRPGGQH